MTNSRQKKIDVVEAYFDCVLEKDFARLPITADYTAQTPLSPVLTGEPAVQYLKGVAESLKGIRIIQHIVEGDVVATMFEEDTVFGPLMVFARFQLESGRVKDVRVFYDPRPITDTLDEDRRRES